jgi:uncharacterized protein (TIGR00369 family)
MTEATISRADQLLAFINRMPFAGFLGMTCEIRGDEMTATLPFREQNLGNAAIGALHGGVIGSFLEMTAMAQVFLLTDIDFMPKTIDLTVDYLRSAGAQDLFARAEVRKLGRRIANVHAEAWQGERANPVASLHAHFLVAGQD